MHFECIIAQWNDTGTLCHLGGLTDARHAADGPMAGAIFETAVFSELFRTLVHRGEDPRIHFWRTSAGREVDFLVETKNRLVPIEVKLSATPRPNMALAIETLRSDLGAKVKSGFVIHPGDLELPLTRGVQALPFSRLWDR